MTEMRDLLEDERAQDSPNFSQLREMVTMYDYYIEATQLLNSSPDNRTEAGRARSKMVKNAFDQWSRSYVQDNPVVEHFYLRVIRPEIRGLADVEEVAA